MSTATVIKNDHRGGLNQLLISIVFVNNLFEILFRPYLGTLTLPISFAKSMCRGDNTWDGI